MKSLAGRTILVTRPAEDAAAWAAEIERRGGRAVVLPCLATIVETDPEASQRLRAALAGADFLALTSRRGVEAAASLVPDGLPDGVRVAAVGPETGRAARERLGRLDLVAAEGNSESLAHDLAASAKISNRRGARARPRLVVAAADRAGRRLEEILEPLGWDVARIAVYRTVPAPPRSDKQDLAAWGVDTILLASPSAAEGLVHQAEVPPQACVISIGPSTTAAARALGLEVAGEARRPDLDGLLEAIP